MKIKFKAGFQPNAKPPMLAAIALLALAVATSVFYWAYRLAERPPAPPAALPVTAEPTPSATSAIFGSQPDMLPSAASLSVSGVIIAPDPADSIAIVANQGQRPRALRVGTDILSGVHLAEVHSTYIVVSDGERTMRIDLPQHASRAQTSEASAPEPASADDDEGLRGEPPHRTGNGGDQTDEAAPPP